jgi:peptidoglycan hydrolase CwlO-like protein
MTAPPRHRIGVGAAVTLVTLAVATASPGVAQIDEKRAEAAALADKLEDQAHQIVALDIQHRRAQDELEDAELAVSMAEADLAATTRRHDDAKRRLVVQAQDAYVVGGSISVLRYLIRANSGDHVVRRAYLRLLSGQDRQALGQLRAVREDLQDMRTRLTQARRRAAARAEAIAGDRAALDRAIRTQQALLTRVDGELAGLIAAEQAQRDAEEAGQTAARLAAAEVARPPAVAVAPGPLAAAPAPAPAPAPAASGDGDIWDCIKQLESGNNYATPGGGAYQFLDSTWHSLGYTGTASDAPPAVQDEAARKLQARDGWAPWPTAALCGRPS